MVSGVGRFGMEKSVHWEEGRDLGLELRRTICCNVAHCLDNVRISQEQVCIT